MTDKNGPWTVLQKAIRYQTKWLTIEEDEVIHPDGKKGVFAVAEILPGISVLPIDDKGDAYLIEEFRYALKRKSIEASSGAIEPGEMPLEAAKRELEEELGIQAQDWVELGVVHPLTSNIHSPAYLFLARKLTFTRAHPEGSEIITPVKMPFEKAVKMVMKSEIVHAPSCVLILKAKEYLK